MVKKSRTFKIPFQEFITAGEGVLGRGPKTSPLVGFEPTTNPTRTEVFGLSYSTLSPAVINS